MLFVFVCQQQKMNDVFAVSMWTDVKWNGLSFIESHDVDGDVRI